jgi:hypothetical protein
MLSRALGEASGSLQAIEAKKTLAGKDFGELVRERRRQFGLPLAIAEKVLPFRTLAQDEQALPASEHAPARSGGEMRAAPGDPRQLPVVRAEAQVAEVWARLAGPSR